MERVLQERQAQLERQAQERRETMNRVLQECSRNLEEQKRKEMEQMRHKLSFWEQHSQELEMKSDSQRQYIEELRNEIEEIQLRQKMFERK